MIRFLFWTNCSCSPEKVTRPWAKKGIRGGGASRERGWATASPGCRFELTVPTRTGDGAFWMGLGGSVWNIRGNPGRENVNSPRWRGKHEYTGDRQRERDRTRHKRGVEDMPASAGVWGRRQESGAFSPELVIKQVTVATTRCSDPTSSPSLPFFFNCAPFFAHLYFTPEYLTTSPLFERPRHRVPREQMLQWAGGPRANTQK